MLSCGMLVRREVTAEKLKRHLAKRGYDGEEMLQEIHIGPLEKREKNCYYHGQRDQTNHPISSHLPSRSSPVNVYSL